LEKELVEPIDLSSFFNSICDAVTNRHPAIYEWIEVIIKKNLIHKVPEKFLLKQINYLFILDSIVKELDRSNEFNIALNAHYEKIYRQYGIRTPLFEKMIDMYPKKRNFFQYFKTISIQQLMKTKIEECKNAYTNTYKLNLRAIVNIFEAVIKDYSSRNKENTLAGLALGLNVDSCTFYDEKNKMVYWGLKSLAASLYESWNLAFCLGNFIYPLPSLGALIIPQIIDSPSSKYLTSRTNALFIIVNVNFLSGFTDRYDKELLENAKELARLLGEINLKYALRFLENQASDTILNRFLKKALRKKLQKISPT